MTTSPTTARRGIPAALVRLAWSTLAGTLVFLSFPFLVEPDSNWWPLAWFALVPMFWALRGVSRKQAFWLGAWTGLVTNMGGFWWISEVLGDFGHLPDYIAWPLTGLNALYQGLSFAFFAYLYVRLRPPGGRLNLFAVAALFTVVEYVFPLIFPWYLGNGQYRFLLAIQIADLTGVMGVTFVMVAFNLVLFRGVERLLLGRELPRLQVGLALALVVVSFGYGAVRLSQVDDEMAAADKLKLGMVEADIGIWEKQASGLNQRERFETLHRNLLLHQTLSADLSRRGAELIVWPESSYFPLDDPFIKRSDRFALALTDGGALAAWRHLPDAGFAWSVERPSLAGEGGGRYRALGAAREDAWAAVGDRGRVLFGTLRDIQPLQAVTDADLLAVDVVHAAGYRRPQLDGARVVLWAVGQGGAIVTGPPERLAVVPAPSAADLAAVSMWNARRGLAVGAAGAVVELGQAKAERVDLGVDVDLHAVLALGDAGGAVIAGARGTVATRPAGGKWVVARHGEATLRHVARGRAGEILIAGDGGALLRYAAGAITAEASPTAADITMLAADARGDLLLADAKGRVFLRRGRSWVAVEAAGLGTLVAGAPLPYVQSPPLPRDIRYLWQSQAALPTLESFSRDPVGVEFSPVSAADQTAVQRGFTTPILFGGITWGPAPPDVEGQDRLKYNTAIMLDEVGRVVGTYDKVYLLVFGEYIPFGETFPGLYDAFPHSGRFTPGTEVKAFDWSGKRIGVMVCYEDILPKFTGELADKSPNIIINVTNDAWFGRTSEPHLHLALSVFRAVAFGLPLLRASRARSPGGHPGPNGLAEQASPSGVRGARGARRTGCDNGGH
ncbi:MAG: hypothetical protein CSA66_05135 [Proteobacteria bacterium]|nr:MAG: hypothetical protein CSA66_05135 [Pseudomonadota bacterium]